MDYEAAIIDFLARKDNLPLVLEIADRLDQLKDKSQQGFWQELYKALKQRLAQSGKSNKWRVVISEEESFCDNSAYCRIEPVAMEEDQLYLCIWIQQQQFGADFWLYYGIDYSQELLSKWSLKQVRTLEAELEEEGFEEVGNDFCGRYKYLDWSLRDKDFMLRWAARRQSVVEQVVELVWMLFESKCTTLEQANRAVTKAIKNGAKIKNRPWVL